MNYNRINSPIVKLHWAGWESDTLSLQRAGWELSAEDDYEYRRVRLALKHPNFKMYAISQGVDWHTLESMRRSDIGRESNFVYPHFGIQQMACDIRIMNIMDNLSKFSPIDAEPSFSTGEYKSIEDLKIFRQMRQAEQQIVIAQHTVPELLEKILSMQDPKQREIREKRNREIRQFMRNSANIDAGKIEERIAAEIIVGV